MNIKISYLSERVYTKICQKKENNNLEKSSYWKKMIGERNFEYLLNNNDDFIHFLSGDEYTSEVNTISDSLLLYLIQEKEDSEEQIFLENDILFQEFYTVIIWYFIKSLSTRLQQLGSFYSETIYRDFYTHLAKQLENICLRTLIYQMHFYKQKELLQGDTASEEYDYFCKQCIGKAWFYEEIFAEYPVLYRCILNKCEQMEDYYTEIVKHFSEDKEKIEKKLLGGRGISRITGIKGGFADSHNSGKQVLQIRIDNTVEILYKPHSMENEKVFYDLLEWFGEKVGVTQYTYPFISKKSYSWSVRVDYLTCETEQQLKKYYSRLGVQLFLAYFLGTKDLHYENIIASGEYPVLIDLEVLVSILGARERKTVTNEIYHQLSQSVLYTGLLPFYYWNQDGKGINSSAISGIGGQKYPFKVPVIINQKTSDMKIEYQYPITKNVQNLATLNDRFCEPYLYKKEIMEGFGNAYRQALSQKAELHSQLKRIENIQNRVLVADTQRYGMMLSSSYHPSLLRDGADREVFLYSMLTGRKEQDIQIVKSEIKSMLDGDIPYFYCNLNEKHLSCGQKLISKNYFPRDGITEIYGKWNALDEIDLEKQKEYINLSLELMPNKEDGYKNKVYAVSSNNSLESVGGDAIPRYTLEELISRLLKYAIWNPEKNEVSWFTVQLASFGQTTWEIKPMNHYLYDGLAGMLLIFHKLNLVRESQEINKIYRTLKEMLFGYTDAGYLSLEKLDSKNTGAYEGESSIAYVYLLLYQQSRDEEYLEYAKKHLEIVEKLIDGDIHYDLLSGNAGAAWISTLIYQITNAPNYIQIAERAIKRMEEMAEVNSNGVGWTIEKGTPPMAGMAHGNSGILMPVIALWKYTGKMEYKILAEQVWNYENSLYNSRIGNWKDMRIKETGNVEDEVGAVAWCHGAAGILLSRITCYELLEDEQWKNRIEKDILSSYVKLKGYWRRDSYCLCHGVCGNLWILSVAGRKLKENGVLADMDLMHEVKVGRISLLNQERINPGFMNGYGGILYAMLKS